MKKRIMTLFLAFIVTGASAITVPAESDSTFVYGTTGYGESMGDAGLDPHDGYSGWSCLRYGVGETLFHYSDEMEVEPWLAVAYEFVDDQTVRITLREDVYFSSGRQMDAQAVKECLENLVSVHDRAPYDLDIDTIEADGFVITIHTNSSCPAIINYLADPYGCIIDMEAGVTGESGYTNVAGTGPYIAEEVSPTEITLVKNENYWGGEVRTDHVVVKSFSDSSALSAALQTGDIQGTYGLQYDNYALFDNTDYTIYSVATSRCFFGQFNMNSEIVQDENIRKAIAMGIDKTGFCNVIMQGRGVPASGAFPDSYAFGGENLTAASYDPEGAMALLEEAGWTDTDGDGYVDKNGEPLVINWLTYPTRLEQPLLAEYAQATLKAIGIQVDVNDTQDHKTFAKAGDFDLYISSLTTAPTGDPQYFFTATVETGAAANYGSYSNEEVDGLISELRSEFDTDRRNEIAEILQQKILDDGSYFFVSFLNMGIVTKANVTGMEAHPCDYYEITANLEVQ